MRLLDRIAQCRTPFVVQIIANGRCTRLSGASDYADTLAKCPIRYVLSDDLVRLCADLAYSKGARTLECADLLRIPAVHLWVEWAEAPWRAELARHGIRSCSQHSCISGRRGAWIQGSSDGRRGQLRTFWTTGEKNEDVRVSSMEAYFDLDAEDTGPESFDDGRGATFAVFDDENAEADLLRRCLRFRYERSWAQYYDSATLNRSERDAIAHRALGTIAVDVPPLVAFFLLLSTRAGLPQQSCALTRLNRARLRLGKAPLLDYVDVSSPLLQPHQQTAGEVTDSGRRSPRLHHVRGHLFRRGSQLIWRVPHVRGSIRRGALRSRTVTWTFDSLSSPANAREFADSAKASSFAQSALKP